MVNVRSMQEDNRIDQLIIVETTLFFSIIHLKTEEENDTKKLIKSFSFVDNSYHKHVNSSINMPNVLPKSKFFCYLQIVEFTLDFFCPDRNFFTGLTLETFQNTNQQCRVSR